VRREVVTKLLAVFKSALFMVFPGSVAAARTEDLLWKSLVPDVIGEKTGA
jgi:hypothetical protein